VIHRPYMWEDVYIYIFLQRRIMYSSCYGCGCRIISRAVSGSPFCYHRFFRVWRHGCEEAVAHVDGGCVADTDAALASGRSPIPSLSVPIIAALGSRLATRSPKEQPDTTNEAHRKPWPVGRVLSVGGIALCVPFGAVSRRHVFVEFVVTVESVVVVGVPKILQDRGWLANYDFHWITKIAPC
jgi:hypothetical protein